MWNTVSATVLAMQGPVLQAVVSRTNGATDLGIISIAFSIATLMMYVGQYGIRRFQASDVNEQFSFEEYHGMRILTCIAMVIASFAYCLYGKAFNGYSGVKFWVIFMVCMLKLVMAYSDVYHGNMQQKSRFDVAAKATAIRYTAELVIFIVMLILTRELLLSSVVTVACSVVMMAVLSMNAGSHYCDSMKPAFSKPALKGLFIADIDPRREIPRSALACIQRQLHELLEEHDGKVIHTEISGIFEHIENRALSGARHAGHDHKPH